MSRACARAEAAKRPSHTCSLGKEGAPTSCPPWKGGHAHNLVPLGKEGAPYTYTCPPFDKGGTASIASERGID